MINRAVDGGSVTYLDLFKEVTRLPCNRVNPRKIAEEEEEKRQKELRKRPKLGGTQGSNLHQYVVGDVDRHKARR